MNIGMRRTRRLLVSGALLLALNAAVASADKIVAPGDKLIDDGPELAKYIRVSVHLDHEKVAKGAKVGFVVTAKNISEKTVVMKFHSTRTFDFRIYSKSSQTFVWNWTGKKLFSIEDSQIVLEPGKKVSYKGQWNQKNSDGTNATSGSYYVVGLIAEQKGNLFSKPEELKIKKD